MNKEWFPGEIAGASLKPLSVSVIGRRVVSVFPGEIAGASLKPVHCSAISMFIVLVPRRNRRGLIEAVANRSLPFDQRSVPRRNRRGLIEAMAQGQRVSAIAACSPAKSPGPH